MSNFSKDWRIPAAVIFFCLIGIVFPLDRISLRMLSHLPGRPPERALQGETDFWSGEWAENVRRELLNNSTVARFSIGPYNEIIYDVTRRLPPAVRLGRDKWLSPMDRPKEIPLVGFAASIEANTRLIVEVDNVLKDRGARLVVGLIPDRSRIYPDRAYLSGTMPPRKAAHLPRLTQALREAGIVVVDLTETLQRERTRGMKVFVSDDHHWTFRGAAASAQALVEANPPKPRPRLAQYTVRWLGNRLSRGSLRKLLGFRPRAAPEMRFADTAEVAKATPILRSNKTCAAYWSTSFGNFLSGEFYANAAGCPVDIVRHAGRGSSWGVEHGLPSLLQRGRHDAEIVVVWEIPEYHTVSRTKKPPSYVSQTRRVLDALDLSNHSH